MVRPYSTDLPMFVIYFGSSMLWNENEEKAVSKDFTVYNLRADANKELKHATAYMKDRGDIIQSSFEPQIKQVKNLHPLEFMADVQHCQLKIEGLDNQMKLF